MKRILFVLTVIMGFALLSSNSLINSHAYARKVPLSNVELEDFMARYSMFVDRGILSKKNGSRVETDLTYMETLENSALDRYVFVTKSNIEITLDVNQNNLIERIAVVQKNGKADFHISGEYIAPVVTCIMYALGLSKSEMEVLNYHKDRDTLIGSDGIGFILSTVTYGSEINRYIHSFMIADDASVDKRYMFEFTADDTE